MELSIRVQENRPTHLDAFVRVACGVRAFVILCRTSVDVVLRDNRFTGRGHDLV